jgi:hypothetical protein
MASRVTSQTDRNRMAELLRQLASGRITNDQFEDGLPALDRDTWPIFRAVWGCYDDLHEHRLRGLHRLSPHQREIFARCCLFLRSGLSYEWPRASRWTAVRAWLDSASVDQMPSTKGRRRLRWLFTYIPHNRGSERRDAQVKSRMIDDRIWPFRRRADLNAALRNPPYLAGGSA